MLASLGIFDGLTATAVGIVVSITVGFVLVTWLITRTLNHSKSKNTELLKHAITKACANNCCKNSKS